MLLIYSIINPYDTIFQNLELLIIFTSLLFNAYMNKGRVFIASGNINYPVGLLLEHYNWLYIKNTYFRYEWSIATKASNICYLTYFNEWVNIFGRNFLINNNNIASMSAVLNMLCHGLFALFLFTTYNYWLNTLINLYPA